MTKWSKLNAVLGSLCLVASLSACYSLGLEKAPEEKPLFALKSCAEKTLDVEHRGLKLSLDYQGPSKALPTERTPWGSVQRYVYPFTQFTTLFSLSIENHSQQTLWLDPRSVSLIFGIQNQAPAQIEAPLGVDFFERTWPALAVNNEMEMLDRSLAMSEVYQKMLTARPVLPGESYQGLLAFRRFQAAPIELKLEEWRWGQQEFVHEFCLNFESTV